MSEPPMSWQYVMAINGAIYTSDVFMFTCVFNLTAFNVQVHRTQLLLSAASVSFAQQWQNVACL